MTDWPPGRGTADRPAVVPAPAGAARPAAAPALTPAWPRGPPPATPLARRAGCADAGGAMVAPAEEPPAEHPAASAQAPAASRRARAAAPRREVRTETRCAGAVMPMGRRRRHGGSRGKVTTWQSREAQP